MNWVGFHRVFYACEFSYVAHTFLRAVFLFLLLSAYEMSPTKKKNKIPVTDLRSGL